MHCFATVTHNFATVHTGLLQNFVTRASQFATLYPSLLRTCIYPFLPSVDRMISLLSSFLKFISNFFDGRLPSAIVLILYLNLCGKTRLLDILLFVAYCAPLAKDEGIRLKLIFQTLFLRDRIMTAVLMC